MTENNEIVVGPFFGGLGDSLQFSTLPELFSESKKQVFLWDVCKFRNDEIPRFVWDSNPFVSGRSSKERNAGDTDTFVYRGETDSHIKNIEISHGFEPTNVYPKVYVNPKKKLGVSNLDICDLGSFSLNFSVDEKSNMIYFAEKYKYTMVDHHRKIHQNVPKFNFHKSYVPFKINKASYHKIMTKNGNTIQINSIFDFWDILCSANSFLTVLSGGYHLAAAAKHHNPNLIIKCFITNKQSTEYLAKNMWKYPGIEYIYI